MRVKAAADYCGFSASWFNKIRTTGGGPKFSIMGKKAVVYCVDDLDFWIAERKRLSTSDTPS